MGMGHLVQLGKKGQGNYFFLLTEDIFILKRRVKGIYGYLQLLMNGILVSCPVKLYIDSQHHFDNYDPKYHSDPLLPRPPPPQDTLYLQNRSLGPCQHIFR